MHFSKKGEGAPVRFISADDNEEAAAIRETDLRNKYIHSRTDLSKKLSLSPKKAKELRVSISLDDDPASFRDLGLRGTKLPMYSEFGLNRLREELAKMP